MFEYLFKKQTEHSGTKQEVKLSSENAESKANISGKNSIASFFYSSFSYLLFWLCFFQIIRAVFLLYHLQLAKQLDGSTILKIFLYGFYVDISASCYLIIIPYLLFFVQLFISSRAVAKLITVYTYCIVTLIAVIGTADLQIYEEWGVKLNATALGYLQYPKEAAASMSSSPLLLLVAILIGLTSLAFPGISLLKKYTFVVSGSITPASVIKNILLFVLGAAFILLGIRGGIGPAPMNPSFAYFSNFQFANHAALNTAWNLLYDVKHYFSSKNNQFVYMSTSEMQERMKRITGSGRDNNTELVLTTDRPNIIIIILESWTADVIQSLGGVKGLTPNFEDLIAKGLLFTNIYSTGSRTSYGIPAVLSGFPSTPNNDILRTPLKMEKMPAFSLELKRAGYSTSFYYGGDDRFDNMRAFFLHAGFEKIINKSSFARSEMDSKWGAHDQFLYEKVLSDLQKEREPFIAAMLTLSSHEPYEVPMKRVVNGTDETSLFKNAMIYADRSLGDFIKKAAGEKWFNNTLFVLVPDHGHRLPLGRHAHEAEKHHIPFLLYGNVLREKYIGAKKTMIGSQTDIPATILSQLNFKHDSYEWSNDLLNKNRNNYAFYNFNNGFGWCTDGQTIGFDNVTKKLILNSNPQTSEFATHEALKDSQAFLQSISIKYSGY